MRFCLLCDNRLNIDDKDFCIRCQAKREGKTIKKIQKERILAKNPKIVKTIKRPRHKRRLGPPKPPYIRKYPMPEMVEGKGYPKECIHCGTVYYVQSSGSYVQSKWCDECRYIHKRKYANDRCAAISRINNKEIHRKADKVNWTKKCKGCKKPFRIKHRDVGLWVHKLFCTKQCYVNHIHEDVKEYRRVWGRERYRTDPIHREKHKADSLERHHINKVKMRESRNIEVDGEFLEFSFVDLAIWTGRHLN